MEPHFTENFFWDTDKRVCSCVLTAHGVEFYGTATCHPNDEDMKSTRTGEIIAFNRAYIKYIQYMRNTQVNPMLKVLTDLYKNMASSHRFNPKSFEATQLYKEIKGYEESKKVINHLIEDTREYLKNYIDEKDKFYQRLRKSKENDEPAEVVLD